VPTANQKIRTELGEHAPARLHRGQLVRVADQHGFAAGCGGGGQKLAQLVGADHGGLIDDDHGLVVESQRFVTQRFDGLGDRRPVSPAPPRIATSTAAPVGANTSHHILAHARGLKMRSRPGPITGHRRHEHRHAAGFRGRRRHAGDGIKEGSRALAVLTEP
jgi:hypothetical protein